ITSSSNRLRFVKSVPFCKRRHCFFRANETFLKFVLITLDNAGSTSFMYKLLRNIGGISLASRESYRYTTIIFPSCKQMQENVHLLQYYILKCRRTIVSRTLTEGTDYLTGYRDLALRKYLKVCRCEI
ncbi:unnamed protein product, partial [Heterotrigona itama]